MRCPLGLGRGLSAPETGGRFRQRAENVVGSQRAVGGKYLLTGQPFGKGFQNEPGLLAKPFQPHTLRFIALAMPEIPKLGHVNRLPRFEMAAGQKSGLLGTPFLKHDTYLLIEGQRTEQVEVPVFQSTGSKHGHKVALRIERKWLGLAQGRQIVTRPGFLKVSFRG